MELPTCSDCDSRMEKVGTFGGMWIIACTRCSKSFVMVMPATCGTG